MVFFHLLLHHDTFDTVKLHCMKTNKNESGISQWRLLTKRLVAPPGLLPSKAYQTLDSLLGRFFMQVLDVQLERGLRLKKLGAEGAL